jgi:uncharacterized protein involved in type VI secretion and phage assembly
MSDLMATLRAIIREELTRHRSLELGIVTAVYPKDSSGSANNHQVNVRLRSSGVELQHAAVAVARAGLSMLPREGDLVAVAFVNGDINAPVVLGSVYDQVLQPPQADALDVVYQPPDDEDSSVRRFHLELPSGNLITIDDEKLHIESGGTELTITRDGDVAVKSAAKVTIESQGDITLEAGGNLQLSAKQNVTVKGMSTTVEGQADAKLKAPQLSLAGMTGFSPS